MDELIKKVAQWHHDRNLIEGASDKDHEYGVFVKETILVLAKQVF